MNNINTNKDTNAVARVDYSGSNKVQFKNGHTDKSKMLSRKIDTYIQDLAHNNISLVTTCNDLKEIKGYLDHYITEDTKWITR